MDLNKLHRFFKRNFLSLKFANTPISYTISVKLQITHKIKLFEEKTIKIMNEDLKAFITNLGAEVFTKRQNARAVAT